LARLSDEVLERVENFVDRVLNVSEEVARQRRSRRMIEQVMASATSVGANVFEADEATSTKEFIRCMSIASRELNETRFWLRLFARREWVASDRLAPLLDEVDQLRRILGTMITRSRQKLSNKT
jgi:four helix bundle protein